MPNYVLFGQSDRITINASSFRRVTSVDRTDVNEPFTVSSHPINPYYEFVDANGEVVAMLNEYQYGNIVREDVLLDNR